MNVLTFDMGTPEADVASLLERARAGDAGSAAALLDDIAPDVYAEVLLEVRDPHTARVITDEALIATARSLRRGEIGSLRELRWRVAARARTQAAGVSERRERLTSMRAGIRHLFGVLAASGLAAYATVLVV